MNITDEDIKLFIKNPIVLFGIMLIGALSSMAKQIRDANKNGADVSFGVYITHWPETLAALGYLFISFAGLVETGTLNIASAWGLGYASNSMADTIREGGRSKAMAPPQEDGPKQDER